MRCVKMVEGLRAWALFLVSTLRRTTGYRQARGRCCVPRSTGMGESVNKM